MKRLTGYLDQLSRESKRVKNIMGTYEEFFSPGVYKFVKLGKTVFYKDKSAHGFLRQQAYDRIKSFPLTKMYFKRLLGQFFRVRVSGQRSGEHQGSFGIVSVNNDLKIFDHVNSEVLSFLDDSNRFLRLEASYEKFIPFFNIPVLGVCSDRQLIIERYIENQTTVSYKRRILSLDSYIKPLESYMLQFEEYINQSLEAGRVECISFNDRWNIDPKHEEILSTLDKDFSLDLETLTWPYLFTHGDLHYQNILVELNAYYFIDWEHSDNHLAFYDPLHYILIHSLLFNDDRLVDAYFNGAFDGQLASLFAEAGIAYKTSKRLMYLALCVAERVAKFSQQQRQELQERLVEYLYKIADQYSG